LENAGFPTMQRSSGWKMPENPWQTWRFDLLIYDQWFQGDIINTLMMVEWDVANDFFCDLTKKIDANIEI
jgi:hypothetical protein